MKKPIAKDSNGKNLFVGDTIVFKYNGIKCRSKIIHDSGEYIVNPDNVDFSCNLKLLKEYTQNYTKETLLDKAFF